MPDGAFVSSSLHAYRVRLRRAEALLNDHPPSILTALSTIRLALGDHPLPEHLRPEGGDMDDEFPDVHIFPVHLSVEQWTAILRVMKDHAESLVDWDDDTRSYG